MMFVSEAFRGDPVVGETNVRNMHRCHWLRRNRAYPIDQPETKEDDVARWCNFYEFSFNKDVWRHVEEFRPDPWKLEVGGLVAKPRTFDLDDLHRAFPLEERIYRHRCVEAWAMVWPWSGFPLAELLKKVEPLPEA